MTTEFFRNAPLAEMIVEVKWRLESINTIPGGAIDPFYDILKDNLVKEFSQNGFPNVITKVPNDVPREFLGGRTILQFRPEDNGWPLYQLGPGVFTVNITKKYNGWLSFQPIIAKGINALISAHPAINIFDINSLQLIAIDAYSSRHGYDNYQQFTEKFLKLNNLLPNDFIDKFSRSMHDVKTNSETIFPLKDLDHAVSRIKIQHGQQDNLPALIVQTSIEKKSKIKPSVEILTQWFDSAHNIHRELFRSLLTDELKTVLQPEKTKHD